MKFDKKAASLDLQHLEYNTFTRKLCKQNKLSPDSVLQLAIQVVTWHEAQSRLSVTASYSGSNS